MTISNFDQIVTVSEYTKERSVKEFFDWYMQTSDALWNWYDPQDKEKYEGVHSKLGMVFRKEGIILAHYGKKYYGDMSSATIQPSFDGEPYDGIVRKEGEEVRVEITDSIDGPQWDEDREELKRCGYSVHDLVATEVVALKVQARIREVMCKKCGKSKDGWYGENKTVLIITFDDTHLGWKETRQKYRDELVEFKRSKIDTIKHPFREILLFGWCEKQFIGTVAGAR